MSAMRIYRLRALPFGREAWPGKGSSGSRRRRRSEGDTRAETPLSLLIRSVRRRDEAEGCAVHISIGEVEIRMVQCVQRLCAELELDSLRQGECSIDRHIPLEETWS